MFEKLKSKLVLNGKKSGKAYRREMAARYCGMHVKYITENRDGVEEVIGRSGSLNINKNGEFIVSTPTETLFRVLVDELDAWELMSKDGVVLTGNDIEHGGVKRTVIVHFVYHLRESKS